jgi:DNA replication protein DnaC
MQKPLIYEQSNEIVILAEALKLKSFTNFSSIIDPQDSFEANLTKLLITELKRKHEGRNARLTKYAGFPFIKTKGTFVHNESTYPKFTKNDLIWAFSCDFIKEHQGVVAIGPTGHGKTHLSIAVGNEAISMGYRVLFKKADDLLMEMSAAKAKQNLLDLNAQLMKTDLLIIDELGFSSYDSDEESLLFKVISDRYEKKSTFITTTYPFSKWNSFIKKETMLPALIDRLIHHSKILNMDGPIDYRYTHALSRKS